MICMFSIGFSYTPDLVPFLEIISDIVYIPKKTDAGHHGNKMAARELWKSNKCTEL